MPRDVPLARGVQVFASLLLVWLVLDGGGSALGVAVGAAAAALGARVAVRLVAADRPHRLRLAALPAFAVYFVVESLRGAADVAWRALHPRLPVEPHLATHVVALPAGAPRTLLLSVVSLLPGTLGADLHAADGTLRVHAITPGALAGVHELERRVARLFGLQPLPAERGR